MHFNKIYLNLFLNEISILRSLAVIYSIYLVFILIFIIKSLRKHERNANIKMGDNKFKPFSFTKLTFYENFEIYFCAILIFPLRFCLVFGLLPIFYIIVRIFSIGVSPLNEYSIFNRLTIIHPLKLYARIFIWLAGVYYIEEKNAKVSDFDESYPEDKYINRKETIPVIVSNHISWVESMAAIQSHFACSFVCIVLFIFI